MNGSGQLVGALNVEVGTTYYNVQLAEGSCDALFAGCNPAEFTFHTLADAQNAAQALLNQVFIGSFDSNYTLTYGCASNPANLCGALVPYELNGVTGGADAAVADNASNPAFDTVGLGGIAGASQSSADSPQFVWALFTRSPRQPVPEPMSWTMMIVGFGAIAIAIRRRTKRALVSGA